jgi:hypothetical protein
MLRGVFFCFITVGLFINARLIVVENGVFDFVLKEWLSIEGRCMSLGGIIIKMVVGRVGGMNEIGKMLMRYLFLWAID